MAAKSHPPELPRVVEVTDQPVITHTLLMQFVIGCRCSPDVVMVLQNPNDVKTCQRCGTDMFLSYLHYDADDKENERIVAYVGYRTPFSIRLPAQTQ